MRMSPLASTWQSCLICLVRQVCLRCVRADPVIIVHHTRDLTDSANFLCFAIFSLTQLGQKINRGQRNGNWTMLQKWAFTGERHAVHDQSHVTEDEV